MRDELNDLLVQFAISNDPGFIIADWIEKVMVASGSKNKTKLDKLDYRKSESHVYKYDDFIKINHSVRGLELERHGEMHPANQECMANGMCQTQV